MKLNTILFAVLVVAGAALVGTYASLAPRSATAEPQVAQTTTAPTILVKPSPTPKESPQKTEAPVRTELPMPVNKRRRTPVAPRSITHGVFKASGSIPPVEENPRAKHLADEALRMSHLDRYEWAAKAMTERSIPRDTTNVQ